MYKNWEEICKLQDWNLMFVIARSNPDDEIGQKLQKGFPECFTETETRGPVPWSVLVEIGKSFAELKGENPEDLFGIGALENLNLPCQVFSTTKENHQRYGIRYGWELAEELGEKPFGSMVTFRKRNYIVVSPTTWIGEIVLVPYECLNMQL